MKIAYIDAQNVHRKTLDYNRRIDWQKFFIYLKQNCKVDVVYYAVWYVQKYDNFYKRLSSIWYTMLFKEVTILPDWTIKWNVDIDIAIRSIFDFFEEWLKKAIIISNDWDYNTLVDVLKKKDVFDFLMVIYSATASKQLRKSAWPYIQDIQRIRHLIEKDPGDKT
ncbi:MAG: hypothetical protein ACD_80C00194G0022 [uncultured bacterium (gcode 4)]|uniref:NYN domain-containing protein n=1 Tax=uncultured bacterium (gcode 4) TaxID=1234023 RepID=K1XVY2_9BACT|nr:MAG: hypothetical protein ACD_80C00194G0022 [uncultured bacterium (gcode 4)]